MLAILRFIAQMSIKHGMSRAKTMAITKFGKKQFKKAMSHNPVNIIKNFVKDITKKTTKKVVAKSKPVKHKTELQRVKAQIARDLKTPKVKPITGKVVGKVRRNYGKWKHIYQKPPKKPKKP